MIKKRINIHKILQMSKDLSIIDILHPMSDLRCPKILQEGKELLQVKYQSDGMIYSQGSTIFTKRFLLINILMTRNDLYMCNDSIIELNRFNIEDILVLRKDL